MSPGTSPSETELGAAVRASEISEFLSVIKY